MRFGFFFFFLSRLACIASSDAAYRTIWMWKSCVLNGRKVYSRLFFRPKKHPFAALFTWIRTNGKTPFFLSEVHLFSIRCEGTKISGIFTNWCQLKARCSHEDFTAKRKIGSVIGGLRQIGWSVWRSHLFSSLSSDFTLIGVYMNTGIK